MKSLLLEPLPASRPTRDSGDRPRRAASHRRRGCEGQARLDVALRVAEAGGKNGSSLFPKSAPRRRVRRDIPEVVGRLPRRCPKVAQEPDLVSGASVNRGGSSSRSWRGSCTAGRNGSGTRPSTCPRFAQPCAGGWTTSCSARSATMNSWQSASTSGWPRRCWTGPHHHTWPCSLRSSPPSRSREVIERCGLFTSVRPRAFGRSGAQGRAIRNAGEWLQQAAGESGRTLHEEPDVR